MDEILFGLSYTPIKPSKFFDDYSNNRICTWARFEVPNNWRTILLYFAFIMDLVKKIKLNPQDY
jgi:hypothetical protein